MFTGLCQLVSRAASCADLFVGLCEEGEEADRREEAAEEAEAEDEAEESSSSSLAILSAFGHLSQPSSATTRVTEDENYPPCSNLEAAFAQLMASSLKCNCRYFTTDLIHPRTSSWVNACWSVCECTSI